MGLIILALDTSEARGSVALVCGGVAVSVCKHEGSVDYSEWLLPTVDELLREAQHRMEQLDILAVVTGPGSFTGLRVGLTTVKAWAEVYGKPVVGVSRLQAMARGFSGGPGFVAAYYDAHRGQIFGGLYRSAFGRLAKREDEVVISPDAFLEYVDKQAGAETVNWISLDPELVSNLGGWAKRRTCGDTMRRCEAEVAREVARVAEERARSGDFSDPLELDANYVRRSDAEIFWKGR